MRRGILMLILIGFAALMNAQTLMYPGDLALINVNADGNKNFDVLIFRNIQAGTLIQFTDDAWINATQKFRGSEGILTYTAPSNLPAGSVISCPGIDGGNGFVKTSGSFNPSGTGDNIIVYQGSTDDPFFLYGTGWARGSTVWEYAETSALYRSDIPPGLSVSEFTITSLGTDDNYRYSASSLTTGTLADLLPAIATPANWQADNTTPFTTVSTSFNITFSPFHISTPTTSSTSSTFSTLPHHTSLFLTSSLQISGPLTCQSLTIAPGGSLELLPGSSLRVFGEIDNQAGAGALIIRSDASGSGSLIHSCPGVLATVERYIPSGQWHFVASPVAEPEPINTLFGTAADHLQGIYYYDETSGQWASAAGSDMVAGRGYNVFYSDEGRTVSFRGTLNSFRTRRWLQVTRGTGAGWNLLGNPFSCSLSWGTSDQADAPGWKNQATILENKTVYITTGGSGDGTTFAAYNGSSGVGVPDNTVGTIASGQGFWVKAAATGELGVGGYAQSTAGGTFKNGRMGEEENGRRGEMESGDGRLESGDLSGGVFRLSVTSLATGQSDQIAVVIDERAEPGIDRFDSEKLGSSGLQLYTSAQDKPLVINSKPISINDPVEWPLTLDIPESGNYELQLITPLNSTLPLFHPSTATQNTLLSLILEDRLTGERHAFRDHPAYAFSAGAGILEGRIVLRLEQMASVEMWNSENVKREVPWGILAQDEKLVLSFNKPTPRDDVIRIVNYLGSEVANYPVNSSALQMIIPKPSVFGIYLAQMQYSSGFPTLMVVIY